MCVLILAAGLVLVLVLGLGAEKINKALPTA